MPQVMNATSWSKRVKLKNKNNSLKKRIVKKKKKRLFLKSFLFHLCPFSSFFSSFLPFLLSTENMGAYREMEVSCSVMVNPFRPQGLQRTWFLYPWNSLGKNTGVIAIPSPGDLPDPESNLGLLHCGQILYPLLITSYIKKLVMPDFL